MIACLAISIAAPAWASDRAVADTWVVPPVVASGTRLPVPSGYAVRWQADGADCRNGILINDRADAVTIRLTGTLTSRGEPPLVKRFTVRVLGKTARNLIAYARTPTDAHDANQPIVARSLHLALDGKAGAAPLNGNYGTLFPIGDYTAVDRVALRGLTDPSLFYFADGSLGVIATRVALSGPPDPSHTSSALVFKAAPDDPASFIELGLVDLRTTDGVVAPTAVWDSATRRYVIGWTDRSGAPRWTTVADLARTERIVTPFFPEQGGRRTRIVVTGNVGEAHAGRLTTVARSSAPLPPGANAASALPIGAATAVALTNRFGRIVNTHSQVDPQTIAPGHAGDVATTRVQLDYSDGSSATRGVDWNADDMRRLAATRSGTVTVRGIVRQPVYPQIFAYNRADPTIYRYDHDGRVRYLFIATDDTRNDNVGSVHLPIRVADSIAALADANGGRDREVDLLNRRIRQDRTVDGRVIAGCYWAPELHEIAGRLTILFAPCFNPTDDRSNDKGAWFTVESHIMQLRPGGDPGNPTDWSKPAAVRNADGSRLGRPGYPGTISLDMSYVEVGGQAYYTWSQRYLTTSGPLGDPLTWIAKVDPAHPTRLASAPRPIIAPNLSFEENLSEGAFAQIHDGRIHLVYSGSGVSPTYVVGGVWADLGADLTAIDSWHKWRAPLQKSVPMPRGVIDYRRYEQGPGHGAFTTDADGNTVYVYHTWGDGVGGDGRDARVRRIHWAGDGRPVLDMTADEEVAPANRAVTMRVTIGR